MTSLECAWHVLSNRREVRVFVGTTSFLPVIPDLVDETVMKKKFWSGSRFIVHMTPPISQCTLSCMSFLRVNSNLVKSSMLKSRISSFSPGGVPAKVRAKQSAKGSESIRGLTLLQAPSLKGQSCTQF